MAPEQHRAVADRLVGSIEQLAGQTDDPHVRAQLHALAGVMANRDVDPLVADSADVSAVVAALARGDEAQAIAGARRVAVARRRRLSHVDWSRASGS